MASGSGDEPACASPVQPPNVSAWLRRRPPENWLSEFFRLGVALPNRRLVDVGSGSGVYSRILRDQGAQVAALDVETACARASAYGGIPSVLGSISNAPYRDDSFDIAFCRYIVHRLQREHLPLAMGQISRIVRPGGQVIVEGTTGDLASRNHDVANYAPLRETLERMHPDPRYLEGICAAVGLTVKRRVVTTQRRPPYQDVPAALIVSERLVTQGVGPSPWLSLNQSQRERFHLERATYLKRQYGSGDVPRTWTGYMLLLGRER